MGSRDVDERAAARVGVASPPCERGFGDRHVGDRTADDVGVCEAADGRGDRRLHDATASDEEDQVAEVLHGHSESFERLAARGYERYAVHGTDVGSGIADLLAMIAAGRVIGTHLSGTVAAMPFGPALETEGLAAKDRERAEQFNEFRSDGIGYLHIQATRPATVGYSLNDSPVGQLAWIADKVWAWTDPAKQVPEDAVDRDQLLTNVSIYWFTSSGASSANSTYEGMQAWRQMAASQPEAAGTPAHQPAGPPKGVAVFAADTTIRSVMDPAGTIEHWSEFDRGGHFPAMETPDLRDFFRKHR